MEDLARRLDKLEEAHAFADRAVEQLSEQVAEAFHRIHRLESRLAALEQRITDMNDPTKPDTTDDDL